MYVESTCMLPQSNNLTVHVNFLSKFIVHVCANRYVNVKKNLVYIKH